MHDCEKMPVTYSSYLISTFFCLLMFYTCTANTTGNGGLSGAKIGVAVGVVTAPMHILALGVAIILYCYKHGREHIRGSSSIIWCICGEWSS